MMKMEKKLAHQMGMGAIEINAIQSNARRI
jgi:hypothetical protein